MVWVLQREEECRCTAINIITIACFADSRQRHRPLALKSELILESNEAGTLVLCLTDKALALITGGKLKDHRNGKHQSGTGQDNCGSNQEQLKRNSDCLGCGESQITKSFSLF